MLKKKEIIIIIKNRNNLSRPISIFYCFLSQLLFLTYTCAQQTSHAPPPPPPPPPPGYYGYNPQFNPSMAIMVVVLISVFFFLGFFSIYLRECIGDRRNREPSNRGSAARARRSSRRGRRGLNPEVIDKFPIFVYSDVKGLKLGKGALECAVCLNEFEDDDTLRLLPKCDHVFHPECIDAWLVAHVTCPVCRSNLNPESMESAAAEEEANTAGNAGDVTAAYEATDRHEGGMTEADNQVTIINVAAEQDHDHHSQPDVINPSEIPNQNRSGSGSTRPNAIAGKFPRSHSTGHSLVQPGENCERFTLRLPEDVRKRIVTGKLNRSTSCLSVPTGDGSTRGGYRSGGEGSSRGGRSYYYRGVRSSERWVFSRTPPFFSRNSSTVPLPSKVTDGDGSTSGGSKGLKSSVKAPFDCLGGKAEGSEESSVRPAV